MTTLAPTLSARYFPRTREWIRSLFLIVLGSLLLAVLAQVEIVLPFTPIPITGQTFGVLLVGVALGSKRGAASMILYLTEGALGLPFFAGGASGIGILTGATRGLPRGLCRCRVYYGSAGRTGVGKKRAHVADPVPCWHDHCLYVRCGVVVSGVGKF